MSNWFMSWLLRSPFHGLISSSILLIINTGRRSGKGTSSWFPATQANVSYDHPFNAPMEHALNIDFVNEDLGPGARVAVELSVESARSLVETILNVLEQVEDGGHVE